MKIILVILTFFALSSTGIAQLQYEEVIYLKNGSVIRGTIVEWVPNVSLTIVTRDENVFVWKIEEIERVTREKVVPIPKEISIESPSEKQKNKVVTSIERETQLASSNEDTKVTISNNNKGFKYIGISEIVVSRGIGLMDIEYDNDYYEIPNEEAGIGLQYINGVMIDESVLLGLGLAYESYSIANVLTCFVDLRIPWYKAKTVPTLVADLGMNGGGLRFNIGLTLDFNSRNGGFILGAGYKVQQFDGILEAGNGNQLNSNSVSLNFLALRTGYYF